MSSRAAIFRPLVSFPTTHSNVNKTKTQLKTAKISAIFCAFFAELCSPSPSTHAFVYVLLFFLNFQTYIFCFNFHFFETRSDFLTFSLRISYVNYVHDVIFHKFAFQFEIWRLWGLPVASLARAPIGAVVR